MEFLDRLKSEIPAFLHYLVDRPYYSQNVSRMWFSPKQLETEALMKLKKSNKSMLEKELIEVVNMIFEEKGVDIVQFQLQDITLSVNNFSSGKYSGSRVKDIIATKWGLSSLNSSYTKYLVCPDGTISASPHKGRYYELTKEKFYQINC